MNRQLIFRGLQLNTVAFLIILGSNLHAADARFCDSYAKTAVKQQVGNIAQNCAEKGSKWSPSYIKHKAWCARATKATAEQQTAARNTALGNCGADSGKISWNTLPNIPTVWDQLFDQMLEAVKKDDVNAVRTMHLNGVSINHNRGKNKSTILYHTVDLQAEKTATYLLSQKANPKALNKSGINVLSKLIEDAKINYRLLGVLLRSGFDPNYGGKGKTDSSFPLLLASKKNDYTAVNMMLGAKGNPNLKRDQTPLLYAIGNRNMSMVQLLIKSGANPNLSGSKSRCLPLDVAIKSGSRAIIQFLKSRGARSAPSCR